jgi:hypothetical protein
MYAFLIYSMHAVRPAHFIHFKNITLIIFDSVWFSQMTDPTSRQRGRPTNKTELSNGT